MGLLRIALTWYPKLIRRIRNLRLGKLLVGSSFLISNVATGVFGTILSLKQKVPNNADFKLLPIALCRRIANNPSQSMD